MEHSGLQIHAGLWHTCGDSADMEEYSKVFWHYRVAILDYFNLDLDFGDELDLFKAISRFNS